MKGIFKYLKRKLKKYLNIIKKFFKFKLKYNIKTYFNNIVKVNQSCLNLLNNAN